MYAALNFPAIQSFPTSSPSIPPPGFLRNRAPDSVLSTRSSRRVPAPPSAVSFAAPESPAVALPGGSLYQVLRVDPTATLTEIKSAYRSLAKVYHPDLSGEGSADGRDFMEIHNAYETLSDPAARAMYDLSLAGSRRRRTRGGSPFGYSGGPGFYPTRRWETDQCW